MKIASSLFVILLAMMTILSPVASELRGGGRHLADDPSAEPIDKLIDTWLASQSLNDYGDPLDTVYTGGTPLLDEETGEMKDRYEYLVEKFPDEPWLSSTADLLTIIDDWLKSQSLNDYGDPMDTVYTGGTPLMDETTGETKDRYEYLLEKFPDEPWLEAEWFILFNQESREQGDTTDDPDSNTPADATSSGSVGHMSALSIASSLFLIAIVNL